MTAAEQEKVDLQQRTKVFALKVVKFVAVLPKNKVCDVLGYQLLKAGTSIGANYREARNAESHNDFIHKVGIVQKEASETLYWLELLDEAGQGKSDDRQSLLRECKELFAIFTASAKTAKQRRAGTSFNR